MANDHIDVVESARDTAYDEKDSKSTSDENVPSQVLQYQPEAIQHLDNLKKQHQWDPNLPDDVLDEVDNVLHTDDAKAQVLVADELLDNSPYPEVRAAVSNIDEGGTGNTFRAWFLGMIFATLGSGLNMLFSMRDPYIIIASYVAQVVSFPIGYAWARYLPTGRFRLFGRECCINPGHFTKKEHTIIVLMANATFGGGNAYATDVLLSQRHFYNQNFGWGFEILLCISTQMLGFGLSGLFQRWTVTPAAMIWPANLVNTTLFEALHDISLPNPAKTNGWKIGKYRLFLYVFIGSFCWYWFPGYIAPFLSAFAFVTFIKPNSPVINQLFGQWTGISLIPLTFDWTQISGFNFSPLIAPWFAIANTLIGMVLFFWIVTPAIHYSGLYYSAYLPISSSGAFDNTGNSYNVSQILTPEFVLDPALYKAYSPLFLSTTFMLAYGLSFATIIATLVHVALFHGKNVIERFSKLGDEDEDVHARMIKVYKPVPLWWSGIVIVIMIALSLVTCLAWETHLSWWAFFVSLIICCIFFIPCGVIQGTTNIQIGLNVITEFIVGYIQPGKPIAMMLFKTYGYISMYQGLTFAQDQKLGMYMKVPPRVTFMAQMISCLWSSVVQVAVMNWALGSIVDVCQVGQASNFNCPNARVFFTASIIWGVIGPQRIFSPGQLYNSMLYFFIPGLIFPIVIYLAARKWPRSNVRYLSAPIIFGGSALIPPATPLNYLAWGAVGYIFNKLIKNRYRGWWMYYNYITSAALDIGLAISTIVIFCCLGLTQTDFPSWWGVNVVNTLDYNNEAIQKVLTNGTFGPATW